MSSEVDQSRASAAVSVALPHQWEILREACKRVGVSSDGATVVRVVMNALFRVPDRDGLVVRITPPGRSQVSHKEIQVARWLERSGVPAVRPVEDVDQLLMIDGHCVTFWHEIPGGRSGSRRELAGLLRQLHALPVPEFLKGGAFDPLKGRANRVRNIKWISEDDRWWLVEHLGAVRAAAAEAVVGHQFVVTHGDASEGNVLSTGDGAFLLDFESVGLAPAAYDLVPARCNVDTFSGTDEQGWQEFCEAYGMDVTQWSGLPAMRSVFELVCTIAALMVADNNPDYREQAEHRLRCIQGLGPKRPWSWTSLG